MQTSSVCNGFGVVRDPYMALHGIVHLTKAKKFDVLCCSGSLASCYKRLSIFEHFIGDVISNVTPLPKHPTRRLFVRNGSVFGECLQACEPRSLCPAGNRVIPILSAVALAVATTSASCLSFSRLFFARSHFYHQVDVIQRFFRDEE